MEDYNILLDKAYKEIKPVESKISRFEVPKVEGRIEGQKTIITNFKHICSYLRRDPNQVLKFLLRATAAPGSIKGENLVLIRKISSKIINEKIQLYVEQYVLCKECKKPDTELIKKDKITYIHCLACGANKPIK